MTATQKFSHNRISEKNSDARSTARVTLIHSRAPPCCPHTRGLHLGHLCMPISLKEDRLGTGKTGSDSRNIYTMFSWVAVSDDKCDQDKLHSNYRTMIEQKRREKMERRAGEENRRKGGKKEQRHSS